MLRWLIRLFQKQKSTRCQSPLRTHQVMADDPNIQEICAQAFNVPMGHAIIGHVDNDGKLHTEEIVVDPGKETP